MNTNNDQNHGLPGIPKEDQGQGQSQSQSQRQRQDQGHDSPVQKDYQDGSRSDDENPDSDTPESVIRDPEYQPEEASKDDTFDYEAGNSVGSGSGQGQKADLASSGRNSENG